MPPIVQMDGAKMKVMNIVKNRVKIETKGREITIYVKMPEPILSAEVCKLVLEKLIEYVSTYKTAKQRDNLAFLEQTKAEAEMKYKQAQQNVAGFKDNSMGVIFQSVQTREQVLQNEMNLAFSVYNQFAMQVEQAKIELKKMCGGENKKYRRVGNECRLTRCPFVIWSVCWSPVKMVCLCVNVQFLVVCSMVAMSSFRLAYNVLQIGDGRAFQHKSWFGEQNFL